MTMIEQTQALNAWHEYRVLKMRLIVMFLGWIPFGVTLGIGSPVIFGSYKPAFFLALAYMIFFAYTWFMYGFYPCLVAAILFVAVNSSDRPANIAEHK